MTLDGIPISAIPLFDGISERSLELVRASKKRHYQDGNVIFHKDERSTEMFVLLHGQVRVEVDDILIVTCPPYEVIGEQAYINDEIRSATVRAQGLTETLVISSDALKELTQDAAFARNLLRITSDKLREATAERAYHYRREELLFTEFKAHVSPDVLNSLLSSGRSYGEPHFIDAVILYSDIRDFTSQSAKMSPQEIGAQLSRYMDAGVDVIHKHGGMVDKFTGDAVLAIWGYSASSEDFVQQALACAEELVQTARSMTFGGQPIKIGIGLNAGNVFIGNVGGEGKRQFTVLGSPVNLAARLESASKELGATIVAGVDFHERLPDEKRASFQRIEHDVRSAGRQTIYLLRA